MNHRATKQVRVFLRLALLVFGISSGWALAEAILALLGEPPLYDEHEWQTRSLHQLDADLIWSLRPNANSRWQTEEFVEIASTNALGLRDAAPRAGGRRIVVLGDSMTFGHGVEDQNTYPHLLETRLNQRGLDVDVLNGGVKGYGIDQAYQLFRLRLRALEPDIVLLAINYNDNHDDVEHALFDLDGGGLRARDPTRDRIYRTAVIKRAVPRMLHWSRAVSLLTRFVASQSSVPTLEFDDRSSKLQWARKKARIVVGKLTEMARQDQFRVAVISMPARGCAADEYAWIRSLDSDVTLLDLHADPGWRQSSTEIFFPTDGHFTPSGNAWVAAQLERFLIGTFELGPIGG